jgi:acyl-CoA thioesterase I
MRTYAIAAVLLLAACGDQPKPRPAARGSAPAAAPAQSDTRPAIVAFGDSLSAGFGLEAGQSFPDLLQADLDRRGLRYRVVNAGISGDTTSDALDRLDAVIALQPAIVILEFGGNDGLRGLPVATTRANLEQLITGLGRGGAKVVLAGMTLPPNYGPDYIRSFQRIYPELAAKYKVALIPFLLEGVGGHPDLMQGDALHPNAAGSRKVEGNVMRALAPLLGIEAKP